jgi:Major capsid protein N-terminus/Large eukaryotic DNA virus major capsid protein
MSINGALIALSAHSPQDRVMWGPDFSWVPKIQTHTPFALQQRSIPLVNIHTNYLGTMVQIDLKPKDLPDLLSNMYLKFTLPDAGSDDILARYTPQVGKAVISQAVFMIDGQRIEALNDDWYIIRDELFLDADQKNSMYKATGQPTGYNQGGTYIVPLEFFFCHRKGSKNPYLPLCALSQSVVSIRFYFNDAAWITESPGIDISDVQLIVEGQILGLDEKLYYMNTPLKYHIPIAYSNPLVDYNNGVASLHLSADFPVTMLVWFIRNKLYETGDPRYFASRYNYGYTTKYIQSSVPVTYFDGTTDTYVDPLNTVTMWFNNQTILTEFPDGIYHSIVQPMTHKMSIPTKNMYIYCFTDNPKEYQMDGAVDFTKLNYKTTRLELTFIPELASQIQNDFSLNLYFVGFVELTIANGKAGFSTV